MPRRATIHLYADDDFERLSELRREVAVAERRALTELGTPRFGGSDDAVPEYVTEAKAAFDAFVDKAAERAEEWVLHPIGHQEFRDLLADHPPRKAEDGALHDDDEGWGFNSATFGRALLTFVDPEDMDLRTVAAPALTADKLAKRIKRLSAGEFDTLWTTAYMLNTGGVADPKLERYSATDRKSSAT